jgi:hypothetical protein
VSDFASPNSQAFTEDEAATVQNLLEILVRALRQVPGGGKMEEGYWSFIYHSVRGVHAPGWSNLPMRDFAHAGIGVEMKLLQRDSPLNDQGRRLMHPAATRTISFDPSEPAEICKVKVLQQFGEQITSFRGRVAEAGGTADADIRWGILLWSPNLDAFLYFEEQMTEPDPDNYRAEFVAGSHRGKPTRNLHIFDRGTGVKRFSVTMPDKGAKVQPYFDVPHVGKGAFAFAVPADDRKPLWLPEKTVKMIEETAGDQDLDEYLRTRLGF